MQTKPSNKKRLKYSVLVLAALIHISTFASCKKQPEKLQQNVKEQSSSISENTNELPKAQDELKNDTAAENDVQASEKVEEKSEPITKETTPVKPTETTTNGDTPKNTTQTKPIETTPTPAPKPEAKPQPKPVSSTVETPKPASYLYGSTVANIANGGAVAFDGKYFYRNRSLNGKNILYREKADGSEAVKLYDGYGSNINVIGNWVYYVNDNGINKVKTDGSQNTKLSDDITMRITVVNDWIYYTVSDSDLVFKLYKIKTDGSSKTAIPIKDSALYFNDNGDFAVQGDWIYLGMFKPTDKAHYFYRMKTDGSTIEKISNSISRYIVIKDSWIYYVTKDYKQIGKMKLDGSSSTIIFTSPGHAIYSVNASDSNLFFSVDNQSGEEKDQGIYSMKLDGSSVTKLLAGNVKHLSVASNWIYFSTPGEAVTTKQDGVFKVVTGSSYVNYRLKIDGTELIKLAN